MGNSQGGVVVGVVAGNGVISPGGPKIHLQKQ